MRLIHQPPGMLALLFAAAALLPISGALLATIHNDVPRLDQYGHIVNAHDGSVVFFGGLYFMYGTVRTLTQASGRNARWRPPKMPCPPELSRPLTLARATAGRARVQVYENCTQHGSQCEGPCGYSPNTCEASHAGVLQRFPGPHGPHLVTTARVARAQFPCTLAPTSSRGRCSRSTFCPT